MIGMLNDATKDDAAFEFIMTVFVEVLLAVCGLAMVSVIIG